MAIFTTNQARHLYVVTSLGEVNDNAAVGTLEPVMNDESGYVYFKYKSPGGVLRSDLIKKDLIEYNKTIPADKMARPLKKVTVTMTGTPIVGADYIVNIEVRQFAGISDEETYDISASAKGKANSTAATIMAEIGNLLKKNLAKDYSKLFNITIDDENLIITEVEQPWNLGTRESVPVYFTVQTPKVEHRYPTGTVEEDWCTITEGTAGKVGNGKKIADMEYFYMGERGDIYRNVGWPNVIHTTYLVDPTKEYDVFECHYSYVGSNESVQKSEKDVTLVFPSGEDIIPVKKSYSPDSIFGDINGDGAVDSTDVSALMEIILGGADPATMKKADINKDGVVDGADITALLEMILKGDEGDEGGKS